MLGKFREIKPTHLWHRTSLKVFRAAIKDRYDAVKNLDSMFQNPRHNLMFTGIVWASALAICYTFGLYDPGKLFKQLSPHKCNTTSSDNLNCKKVEDQKKIPNCPPVNKKGPC